MSRAVALALCFALACGKSTPPGGPVASASGPIASPSASGGAGRDPPPRDAKLEELWERAGSGNEDDRMRLADVEGSFGLVERGQGGGAARAIAIRALAFAHDFVGLPWLATVAVEGDDGEAAAALESVVDLAAAPRRSVDPEDARELREGCDRLLALAKATDKPADRRIPAIRALRMLAERGCVKRGDIPSDLDAR